jgi:hypothetical protein
MSVQNLIEETFTEAVMEKLRASSEALMIAVTGKERTLTVPVIKCFPLASNFRLMYTEKTGSAVDETFAAPAFAVQGAVYINGESRDWIKEGAPNARKIVSTVVHEFFHSASHLGKGVQAADTDHFKGPGSYMYMDEVLTDLLGYIMYDELSLAQDGNYETAYIVNTRGGRTSMQVGTADGGWLSLAFLCPAFDGLRKKILCAYFHGDSLTGVDVDLPRCVKAIEVFNKGYDKGKTPDATTGGGLPFSYAADKVAISTAILGAEYGPYCDIKSNAIPVTKGTTLKTFLSDQGS